MNVGHAQLWNTLGAVYKKKLLIYDFSQFFNFYALLLPTAECTWGGWGIFVRGQEFSIKMRINGIHRVYSKKQVKKEISDSLLYKFLLEFMRHIPPNIDTWQSVAMNHFSIFLLLETQTCISIKITPKFLITDG